MDLEGERKKPESEEFSGEIKDWLRQTSKLLLAIIALLVVGPLGRLITGNDLFWLIFLLGLVLLFVRFSPRHTSQPQRAVKKQVHQDQVPLRQVHPKQVSQRRVSMAQRVPLIISHWYHLIEGLQDSPQRFYASVEDAIKKRQIPDVDLSRVDYREGGIFSAKREYLRVRRNEYVFDICAAPFGNGFFVSWWLGELTGCLWGFIMLFPFMGPALMRIFRPETYYRLDTTLMFQESIRSTVLEVIDEITKAKGLRVLSEMERKPIMTSLFKK